MADFKRIPYGISNFKQLRWEGLYWTLSTRRHYKTTGVGFLVQLRGYEPQKMEEIERIA
ncbi:MAG: hypothetical protein J6Z14_07365 [Prevotella sp.]|nr:hypothetical protein [Prevotella sp.]